MPGQLLALHSQTLAFTDKPVEVPLSLLKALGRIVVGDGPLRATHILDDVREMEGKTPRLDEIYGFDRGPFVVV